MNTKPTHFQIESHAVTHAHRTIKRRLDTAKTRAHRHERRKLREQLRHTDQYSGDEGSLD